MAASHFTSSTCFFLEDWIITQISTLMLFSPQYHQILQGSSYVYTRTISNCFMLLVGVQKFSGIIPWTKQGTKLVVFVFINYASIWLHYLKALWIITTKKYTSIHDCVYTSRSLQKVFNCIILWLYSHEITLVLMLILQILLHPRTAH